MEEEHTITTPEVLRQRWVKLLMNSAKFGVYPDDKDIFIHSNVYPCTDFYKYYNDGNDLAIYGSFRDTEYASDILNVKVERYESIMIIMWWISKKLHQKIVGNDEPNDEKNDIMIDFERDPNVLKNLIARI